MRNRPREGPQVSCHICAYERYNTQLVRTLCCKQKLCYVCAGEMRRKCPFCRNAKLVVMVRMPFSVFPVRMTLINVLQEMETKLEKSGLLAKLEAEAVAMMENKETVAEGFAKMAEEVIDELVKESEAPAPAPAVAAAE